MSPKRRVTLKQVAELAEVSRAAASFALSGRPGVSDATREKVLRIAADLGYSPNRAAQNLRTSRSGIVAVYLPENVSTMSYYMEATFGIIDRAEAAGLIVTLLPHGSGPGESGPAISRVTADGIIVLDPAAEDATLVHLLELGLPIVSGEAMPTPLRAPEGVVVSDHAASTREILDAFAAAGAKHPAIITTEERMSWAIEIEGAYRSWCADHDIAPRFETAALDRLIETTQQATHALLSEGEVDAIIALTDGSVLSVITSAAEFGRTIGEDLLIAAAVDSPVLGYMDPAVTAVDLRPREFGRACMAVLERVLAGETGGADAGGSGPSGSTSVRFRNFADATEVSEPNRSASSPIAEVVPTKVIHRASTAGPVA